MRIIRLDTTGSTNSEARKLTTEADLGPVWISAKSQQAGKGRTGRSWVSPIGNLYASYLFPSDIAAGQKSLYSFVATLAVFDTLIEFHPDGDFGIKWPNDVLLGKAKISGMLLETGQVHRQGWVIAGIGINVKSHPADLPYPATSLGAHLMTGPDPSDVLDVLIDRFEQRKTEFETQGFAPIREAWKARAMNLPGPVKVRLPSETFEGQAVDLGQNGALQVRLSTGTMRDVHAGDVFLG